MNNAGGALGLDRIADADDEQWRCMYDTNVLGTLRMTRALLPELLVVSGDGHVIVDRLDRRPTSPIPAAAATTRPSSECGRSASVLRQELLGQPVRVTEVDPGMVETEFSLVRFDGDAERAAQVYDGVTPLTADDVADVHHLRRHPTQPREHRLARRARPRPGRRPQRPPPPDRIDEPQTGVIGLRVQVEQDVEADGDARVVRRPSSPRG